MGIRSLYVHSSALNRVLHRTRQQLKNLIHNLAAEVHYLKHIRRAPTSRIIVKGDFNKKRREVEDLMIKLGLATIIPMSPQRIGWLGISTRYLQTYLWHSGNS